MADNRRRLNLSLNLSAPHQREAWKLLCAIPDGQRTDAVCRAVCRFHEQDALLKNLRTVIREELRNVKFITATESKSVQPETGDAVDESVLGFLRSLQEGG